MQRVHLPIKIYIYSLIPQSFSPPIFQSHNFTILLFLNLPALGFCFLLIFRTTLCWNYAVQQKNHLQAVVKTMRTIFQVEIFHSHVRASLRPDPPGTFLDPAVQHWSQRSTAQCREGCPISHSCCTHAGLLSKGAQHNVQCAQCIECTAYTVRTVHSV